MQICPFYSYGKSKFHSFNHLPESIRSINSTLELLQSNHIKSGSKGTKMKVRCRKEPETLCVVVSLDDQLSLKALKTLQGQVADILEIRIDRCTKRDPLSLQKFCQSLKKTGLPLLATVRSREEGGVLKIPSSERLSLFKALAPYADFFDVELSSKEIVKDVVRLAREHQIQVILSFHNFKETPKRRKLEEILRKSLSLGADIVKIAAMTNTPRDMQELLRFLLENNDKKISIIAMGPQGVAGRVLFPAAGSLLTYTYLSESSAPGQLPLKKMTELMKLFYHRKTLCTKK